MIFFYLVGMIYRWFKGREKKTRRKYVFKIRFILCGTSICVISYMIYGCTSGALWTQWRAMLGYLLDNVLENLLGNLLGNPFEDPFRNPLRICFENCLEICYWTVKKNPTQPVASIVLWQQSWKHLFIWIHGGFYPKWPWPWW